MINSIKVVRRGKVRRAKLYYLRGLRGKRARITEKQDHRAEEADAASMMRAMTGMTKTSKKAGLLGLFLWLALAGAISPVWPSRRCLSSSKRATPPPPRKSLRPPLRIQVQTAEVSSASEHQRTGRTSLWRRGPAGCSAPMTLSNIGRRLVLRIDGRSRQSPSSKRRSKAVSSRSTAA